jgi:uncharacterized Rossmann fold enzyme
MTAPAKAPKVLDANDAQPVKYCIPLWLRDQQIAHAIQRVSGRIEPSYEPRTEPIAVVCYGPSLNDTWEQVKAFPRIMTCSGSHKFLLERGVVPTYHVEVDPRKHKVELMGPPHPDVEYLISSTCHGAVFDHLEGQNVKLWHVFDSAAEGLRVLPHGEWAITGGCNVGLRALTLAAFLGYRELHVFGMDGCQSEKYGKHAAAHPNQPKDFAECVVDGVTYRTTQAMLEAARGTLHELDQMPGVRATFYGEGLVQALVKQWRPKTDAGNMANVVGFRKPMLISAEYARLNAQLHRENPAYGVGGAKHAETVLRLAESINARSVLDYGCGKGELGKALPFGICEYDPAIPGKSDAPRPADLVCCTDCLEHIEPEMLNDVLNDLRRCVLKIGFFTIHTGPASKTLPDGRNTHLSQHPRSWWEQKLAKGFTVGKIVESGPILTVIVGKKQKAPPPPPKE